MTKAKFIHTADIHLGMKFDTLGDKGKIQREQVMNTFGRIIDKTLSERVDGLLIAGDLFDSNTPSRNIIDFVYEQFSRLASEDLPVIMIPGNHDYYCDNSVYKKYDICSRFKNVTLLKESGQIHLDENLDAAFYGFPNLSKRSHKSPFQGFTVDKREDSSIHIGIAHGSYNIEIIEPDDHVFGKDEIEQSGLSYVALGHWHNFFEIPTKEVRAFYSGSPEFTSMGQRDRGKVLLIDTDGTTTTISPIPIGKRMADSIKIDVSGLEQIPDIKKQVLKQSNPEKILDLILVGLRNQDLSIDVSYLEDELSDKFFKIRIWDESHLGMDSEDLSSFSEETVIGQFVAIAKQEIEECDEEERTIKERALQIGLAVLQGKEVL